MADTSTSKAYEWKLVILFFFSWGFIFLDRLAVVFLGPTLVKVFSLNNAQVGMIGTVTTGGYALAVLLFGIWAPRLSKPKLWLAFFTVGTAVVAVVCSLVQTYSQLLVIRAMIGMFEGPILPLMMVMVSKAASEDSLGLDVGIINLGVVAIGITLGSVLVTQILVRTSWQAAFLLSAIPSLVLGILVLIMAREVDIEHKPATGIGDERVCLAASIVELFGYRNIRICAVVSIVAMSGYWGMMIYAPLYLTEVNKLSMETMGFITSAMGIGTMVYAVLIPKLSDNFGRKPILILFLILPAAGIGLMALMPGTTVSTVAYVICGNIIGCVIPLFFQIIPLESVPDYLKASATSMMIGLGEIIGGALFPYVAGVIADAIDLPAMMGVMAALLVVPIVAAFLIRETLSKKTVDRQTLVVPSESSCEPCA